MTWVTKCPEKGILTLTYSRFEVLTTFALFWESFDQSLLQWYQPQVCSRGCPSSASRPRGTYFSLTLSDTFKLFQSIQHIVIVSNHSVPSMIHQVFKNTLAHQRRRCCSFVTAWASCESFCSFLSNLK
jgi:hypothetical protein